MKSHSDRNLKVEYGFVKYQESYSSISILLNNLLFTMYTPDSYDALKCLEWLKSSII